MLAWHYTTGENFALIMASGLLQPASLYVVPPEKPILWFSLHPYWENTANKAWVNDSGMRRALSMQETFTLGGGLFRFGCDPHRLLTGEALRRRAHIKSGTWRGLCAAARQQHASPSDWFGVTEPMPLDGLVIEEMNDAWQWVPWRVSTPPERSA